MSDVELPVRPRPPRGPAEAVGAWLAWFGVARLFAVGVSLALVGAGAFWLVRTPPPSNESVLPMAAGVGGAHVVLTLPPPLPQPSDTREVVGPLIVHVAGAVRNPGVYELQPDDRVHGAIELAGGPTAEADLDGLNLAAVVADGQRIYLPAVGEVDPATVPSGATPVEVGGSAGPLDLNTATAVDLESLPGVGPATAAAIVDDRVRHGPFAAVDDLDRVPGIGPAKLASLRDLVTV